MKCVLRYALCVALLVCALCGSALSAYATLSYGDSGKSVLELQQALTALGYNAGTLDGKFGAFTELAVRSFQRDHQLKVDGKAGDQTQTLIYSLTGAVVKPTAAPTAAPTASLRRPTRTLRRGDSGSDVTSLQTRLADLGYYAGRPSGSYDTATYAAVTAFQILNGLTADGVVGSATCARLFSTAATPYPTSRPTLIPATTRPADVKTPVPLGNVPTRTLRYGSSGSDVASLQQRLQSLGYYTGAISGSFDQATRAALVSFQQRNGLSADGMAGQMTYARLYSANAVAAPLITQTPAVSTPAPTRQPVSTPQKYVIPTRTLRYGYTGSDVVSVQQRLTALGYLSGATGVYDTATMAAVRLFQLRNGLSSDGLAGSRTCALLFSSAAKPAAAVEPTVPPTQAPTLIPTQAPTPIPTPTATAITRTLRSGCTGEDVKALQTRLAQLGYFTTTITGSYASSTVSAVKAFQRRNGLSADGVAGSMTLSRLYAANAIAADPVTPAPTAPASTEPVYRMLSNGATGEDVMRLQQRLASLGYPVSVTGTYDSATASAVRQFQTNNYLGVDGIAGTETQRTLYSANPARADETPVTSYTTLSVNSASNSAALQNLQRRLIELGYPAKANGKYDGNTHNAVVAFQQRNGLTITGIANGATQAKLFAASALPYSTPVDTLPEGTGRISTPGGVQALWWYKDIKPTIRAGQTVVVFDPNTNLSWNIKLYSLGHHADSQPASWRDTQIMNRSFGKTSWDCHPVYVQLPSGTWVIAAMHNYPHLYGTINDNGFGGHLCIHFLRDINECISAGDANYGVAMQKAIRSYWQALTGETID